MRLPGWAKAGMLCGVLLILALRVAAGAALAVVEIPFDGNAGAAIDVVVVRGSSAAQVAAQLQNKGVIRRARDLRLWMHYQGRAGNIHAGEYRFQGPHSIREVHAIVTEGRVALVAITIPEGATRWQVAESVAAAGFGTYDEAWAATANSALVADIDADAADLEGYLFPDTYHARRDLPAADIVAMMVRQFRRVWTPEHAERAAAAGFSIRETLTIASLIEAETGRAGERSLVSGVFHNRLQQGMLLQCDPTLLYALYLDGRRDRDIRRGDFDNPSPYNTYRVRGLPPGPIGNPGAASIKAALAPASTEYLYFVGRNDGSHAFSSTLREHNNNVNRYQR